MQAEAGFDYTEKPVFDLNREEIAMKVLVIKPNLCTNCHICELACSFSHSNEFSLAYTRVRTIFYPEDDLTVPETCLQCIDASCMKVCPSGAIELNETLGAVLINYDKCIGCMSCVGGCPFGNMLADPKKLGHVFKCDLCGGDPVCARFCPTGAIVYEEFEPMAGKQEMVLEEEAVT
jgi:Fe-S-cluster-containing dehydrogenase component